ncbi:MAG: ribosome biogenesis GTP-binding protein YihA/YsxC [Pseudomonadota bacterium]
MVNFNNASFVKSATKPSGYPEDEVPEIAVIGRSNVGKSSLINALVRQKGLARTSNTPGRTQELNVFVPEPGLSELFLFDLPGYGYAKAPKGRVDGWTRLVKDYLRGRPNLTRVFLLIDSRHGLKPVDEDIMEMLDQSAVTYQVVLTKIDKISVAKADKIRDAVVAGLKRHPAAFPEVILSSSEKGHGIDELRDTVAGLVGLVC